MTADMKLSPVLDRDTIGAYATELQETASNPSINVWVGASAGTGKTKVLTDRVLRLLLPIEGEHDGTPPHKILCITYTKAGASEMVARIMDTLSTWATCDNTTLDAKLTSLLGHEPSLRQRDKARKLFAEIVDLPEGLKINTIHAFCQSVLGRFPIEANVSPHVSVIDDGESMRLIHQARNDLMIDIRQGKTTPDIEDAFMRLAKWKNGDEINGLIQSILKDREKIKSMKNPTDAVYRTLGISVTTTRDSVISDFFTPPAFHDASLRALATALSHGATGNKNKSGDLLRFLNLSLTEQVTQFDDYANLFLTGKGEPYAESHITKGAREFDPQSPNIFQAEASRVQGTYSTLKAIGVAQSTLALLTLARDLITRYETLKTSHNFLDYDDLIYKTRDLFLGKTPNGDLMRPWVLYKMDGGIDHILVDEAQDTNPAQWDIVWEIAHEFFAGEGTRDDVLTTRTIFVVGDEKQSIYRFQGADPKSYLIMRSRFTNLIADANKNHEDVPMATSFRSTSAVLDCVDAVFNQDALFNTITPSDEPLKHVAYRQGESGQVELWPVYKTPKAETREPWTLPIMEREAYDSKSALAKRIADQIDQWISNNEILTAHNRPIEAGDIMILVRSRNIFVDHLIRALKSKNIPVSGVDRMIVADQIAVQDILATLKFGLMPDDDLSLAATLKSPFIGWDDATLEDYAYPRQNTLWEEIKSRGPTPIVTWLSNIIAEATSWSAFDGVNAILNTPTPNQGYTGWKAIASRLGHESIDPIEELIGQAQNYDMQHPALGLQGFITAMQGDKRSIKREMENTAGQVRIMTVHASKGLQAPIVFLPDTCAMPKPAGESNKGFVWNNDGTPLWIPSSDDADDTYNAIKAELRAEDLREYYRLLYVAMTRAEDRLIISGFVGQRSDKIPEGCWYDVIENALMGMPMAPSDWQGDDAYVNAEAKLLNLTTVQTADFKTKKANDGFPTVDTPLPEWVSKPMPAEQHPPKTLMPSKMDDADVPVRSPLHARDDSYRFQRGLLTHSLLQYLPDIAVESRADAATRFITKQAPDLPENTRQSIITESLNILSNPVFAPFFATGSLAEVPITGMVDNPKTGKVDIISGQIDRLLVTDDTVWIVDYKSNRPPPRDVRDVPAQYKNQMRAYRILMQDIYPNHSIRTALLWTDGPAMMEIIE